MYRTIIAVEYVTHDSGVKQSHRDILYQNSKGQLLEYMNKSTVRAADLARVHQQAEIFCHSSLFTVLSRDISTLPPIQHAFVRYRRLFYPIVQQAHDPPCDIRIS